MNWRYDIYSEFQISFYEQNIQWNFKLSLMNYDGMTNLFFIYFYHYFLIYAGCICFFYQSILLVQPSIVVFSIFWLFDKFLISYRCTIVEKKMGLSWIMWIIFWGEGVLREGKGGEWWWWNDICSNINQIVVEDL